MSKIINEIEDKFKNGKTKEVIDKLLDLTRPISSEYYNKTLLYSSQFEQYTNQYNLGILPIDSLNSNVNKISNGLLDILDSCKLKVLYSNQELGLLDIQINGTFEDFTSFKEKEIVRYVASLLNLNGDEIIVIRKIRGSIILRIALSQKNIDRLLLKYEYPSKRIKQELNNLNVESFTPIKDEIIYKINQLLLDRYRVISNPIEGGMARVYLCEDKITKNLVAVKTIKRLAFKSEQDIKDFKKEALNWVRLDSHFNVVKVLDIDSIDYSPVIIMEGIPFHEWKEGVNNLHGYLTKDEITVEEGIKFAIQLCDAMIWISDRYEANGKTFVHQDIKPQNIMITPNRRLKLTDFGIADTDFFGGTAGYMSPEQINKEKLDERSDIYSFGCMFYEVFCKRKDSIIPETRKPIETIETDSNDKGFFRKLFNKLKPVVKQKLSISKEEILNEKHLVEKVIDPKSFLKESKVAPQLRKIILQCLEKDKIKRPNNFAELRESFNALYKTLTNEEYPSIGGRDLTNLDLIAKGESLYFLEKYDEALICFEDALTHFSPYPEYPHPKIEWNLIGRTLNRLVRKEEALEYYKKVLAIDNNDIPTLINKGILFKGLKEFDKELECYNKILKIEPNNLTALFNKANVFYSLRQYEHAVEEHKKVLEFNPNYSQSWCDMGLAFSKLNEFEKSLNCYFKALEIDRRDFHVYIGIGGVFKEMKNYEEAYRYYEKALDINPNLSLPWLNVGVIFSKLSKHEEAIALYQEALFKKNPEKVKIFTNMGTSFGMLKRDGEALECFNKALAIDPNYHTALQNIGTAYIKLNRDSEALSYLKKALKINEDDKITIFNIGECYLGLQKYNDAISWYKKTLEKDPNFSLAVDRIRRIKQALG